jgi:hypothetical protein
MPKRVLLAASDREYAGKLAAYLREEEPGWDIAAFTNHNALRMELMEGRHGVDLIVGESVLLREVEDALNRVRKVMTLVDDRRSMSDAQSERRDILKFQPLHRLRDEIREGIEGQRSPFTSECRTVAVMSASGGVGKTSLALNMVRQSSERGYRTFYFNLEALSATSLLFGLGEPDSLSMLLYALQTHPEQWDEHFLKLCKHQPQLRADRLDVPDHPGERLAMTPDMAFRLVDRIRRTGKYDLIVIDPDHGEGEWHLNLLQLCDRAIWLTTPDPQGIVKADKLLRYWASHNLESLSKVVHVLNKDRGEPLFSRWALSEEGPAVRLPYVSQWKQLNRLDRLLGAPAFCGAVEELLDDIGIPPRMSFASNE